MRFILMGTLTCLVLACGGNSGGAAPSTTAVSVVGDPSTHARIKALTDCVALREQLDIALDNAARYRPSDPKHAIPIAYADTARARRSELSCKD